MSRITTPTFVTEFPVIIDSHQERELLGRFQAGRQLYNACLGEAMVRMNRLRNSEVYQQAKALPKKITNAKGELVDNPVRKSAFAKAYEAFNYSDYSLQAYATHIAKAAGWIARKLDVNTQQTLATRAFKASQRVLFGKAKQVRYKVTSRFHSLEGKTNKQGIRWKEDQFIWGDLKIRAMIDYKNEVLMHGLASRIKYCRILWRILNGKRRWYVQLVNEGLPYTLEDTTLPTGTIGIDLNVSTVAIVADQHVELAPFCQLVNTKQTQIKQLQRQLDRSQRSTNPGNYEPDFQRKRGRKTVRKRGKVKRGARNWLKSKRYRNAQRKLRELERKQAAYRRSEQRRLVNRVLQHGNHIKLEQISVKGWQKIWGKAIKAKAPGFFQSELIRKAESAGGSVEQFPTRTTKLSQTCICGQQARKSLSQRVHRCECGVQMHRDLMSGFLSRYVNQGLLSCDQAKDGWMGLEPILQAAWQQYANQYPNRVGASESPQSGFPAEGIACQPERYVQMELLGHTEAVV